MQNPRQQFRIWALASTLLISSASTASSQATAFSYQGRLSQSGNPANGIFDLLFQIFDASDNGTSIGGTLLTNGVPVTNGLFALTLNFGATPFNGSPRWLQIQVSTNGEGNFTTLLPRQPLTAVPTAIYANSAGSVTNGAITSTQLAANSVAAVNLQTSAVTSNKIASGQVVKSLNGLTDSVGLTQGANVTITTNGNSLQISAPAGGLALPYSGSSAASTVFSVSNSSSGTAIAGLGTGGNGRGVFGSADYGVWGQSDNVGGRGVVGKVTSDFTAIGVIGEHTAYGNVGRLGTSRDGVYGISDGIGGGNGVSGYNTAAYNGVGVFGQHTQTGNYGQLGHPLRGIEGVVTNMSSVGARGTHVPTGNYGELGTATEGVRGVNTSAAGAGTGFAYGVIGLNAPNNGPTGAFGALGVTHSVGSIAGVYGVSTNQGTFAGVFTGNVLIQQGTLNPSSDREAKENFTSVNSRDVLEKLVALPISRWNFKGQGSTSHIGPMAQDFYAAFRVGLDNRHISTVDADGVALAAIQGLHEVVAAKEARISELERELAEIKRLLGGFVK